MTKDWRDGLSLKLEDFVDTFVVKGAKATDVYDAIQNELDRLRVAYDRDPDPADDQSDDVVEEPSTTGRLPRPDPRPESRLAHPSLLATPHR
ncbi:hypothetical protein ACC694_22110 [Rhizobium ruizarguesonis]